MRNLPAPHAARRPRGPLARWSTALVALLYLLAWGEPLALHACPMHDGVAGAAVAAVRKAAAAPAADAVAAHAADDHAALDRASSGSHAAAPAHADHGADDGSHLCQCLGHGCCPAGVATPTAQAVRWQVVVRRLAEPPAPVAAERPAARGVRLLPFANGPPAQA